MVLTGRGWLDQSLPRPAPSSAAGAGIEASRTCQLTFHAPGRQAGHRESVPGHAFQVHLRSHAAEEPGQRHAAQRPHPKDRRRIRFTTNGRSRDRTDICARASSCSPRCWPREPRPLPRRRDLPGPEIRSDDESTPGSAKRSKLAITLSAPAAWAPPSGRRCRGGRPAAGSMAGGVAGRGRLGDAGHRQRQYQCADDQ